MVSLLNLNKHGNGVRRSDATWYAAPALNSAATMCAAHALSTAATRNAALASHLSHLARSPRLEHLGGGSRGTPRWSFPETHRSLRSPSESEEFGEIRGDLRRSRRDLRRSAEICGDSRSSVENHGVRQRPVEIR